MASLIRKFYRKHLKPVYRKIDLVVNKMGHDHKCNICGNTFSRFLKFGKGTKGLSDFLRKLDIIGSDIDNFGCIYCGATDRERHLFLYFDYLKYWGKFSGTRVLHFAPEPHLSKRIKSLDPKEYVMADLYPVNPEVNKVDITQIPFVNDSFDIIICNHVLEHVSDFKKALTELFRVLKPEGFVILQTPYSNLLNKNFEDKNIYSEDQREFFYGQKDHVRVFGKSDFFASIVACGFDLTLFDSIALVSSDQHHYFGMNTNENLILLKRMYSILK